VTSAHTSTPPVGAAGEVAPSGVPLALVGSATGELAVFRAATAAAVLACVGDELLHAASSKLAAAPEAARAVARR
jgi:hypothetical protein